VTEGGGEKLPSILAKPNQEVCERGRDGHPAPPLRTKGRRARAGVGEGAGGPEGVVAGGREEVLGEEEQLGVRRGHHILQQRRVPLRPYLRGGKNVEMNRGSLGTDVYRCGSVNISVAAREWRASMHWKLVELDPRSETG